MHVVSYKRLREFGQKHPDCRDVLDDWLKVAIRTSWSNLIEVQAVLPQAEAVGKFTIFSIKGNRYRLTASIDYKGQLVYINYVLTHAEYDKEQWKHDPHV